MKTASLLTSLSLAALGAALRLAGARATPDTFDEVSFLTALERFDLLTFEPHFPGYPAAVLLARLADGLGAEAPYAAAAAALLLFVAWRLHRAAGGGVGGTLAVGLVSLALLAVTEGARPMADSIATALLTLALAEGWLAVRRPGARASALAGLALGCAVAAKPDLLAFACALPLLCSGRPWRTRAAVAAAFGLPLLLATAAIVEGTGGLLSAWDEATRFLTGHLTEWGGGALAAASEQPRIALATAPLAEASGATSASLLLGGLLLMALALRAPRKARRAALVVALPYGLWTLFGQNLEHPRHVLPLLPVVAWLVGLGASRLPARPPLRALLAAALLLGAASSSLRALTALTAHGRPTDRLLATLDLQDPLRTRVYASGRGRALRSRRPELDVRRARDLAAVRADVAADPCPPACLLVTSDVPGAAALPLVAKLGAVDLHRLEVEQ